ncbi:hypothetical protein PFUGPA_00008 [Plasmodium falciparum Palo Alto/Uganda]|uniref:Rifin n=1 Tax=Plasmodium falciparum (isolate Palo Alto / Uganda) TaxID=57270 RepID=W4J7J2_PLAFP|nr:hypothetical protein PFUGPA_00008 [Plasmodium falciparum Palo Alto/Uganda]
MKVHYINILLFSLPLNILEHNPWNHYMKPHTYTNRSLCECELYELANYDNDPQMKEVMQDFDRQTSQRFEEYNERMMKNRQKCKEQCDKEIQKIILKDKLEKQMAQQFSTLHTDIQSDAIPTCICEKSLADKVEKGCLRCAQNLGGIVVPSSGVLGGIGEFGLSVWKPAALEAAKKAAIAEGLAAGEAAGNAKGMEIVIHFLEKLHIDKLVPDICKNVSSKGDYTHVINFVEIIIKKRQTMCGAGVKTLGTDMCTQININLGTLKPDGISPGLPDNLAVPKMIKELVGEATQAADAVAKNIGKDVAASITKEKTSEIAATYASWETTIIAAVVAIVVIVLIMVIIYLILRYLRKKKMKKKLQYIKLLKE